MGRERRNRVFVWTVSLYTAPSVKRTRYKNCQCENCANVCSYAAYKTTFIKTPQIYTYVHIVEREFFSIWACSIFTVASFCRPYLQHSKFVHVNVLESWITKFLQKSNSSSSASEWNGEKLTIQMFQILMLVCWPTIFCIFLVSILAKRFQWLAETCNYFLNSNCIT